MSTMIFSKEEIALHRIPALKDILCKPELLATIADFHFRKEHPAEALSIYKEITDMNHADAEIFQKTGYCLQKEKRYKEAIEAYRKADVLKPDHVWTIRHLATCHRQLRDFATALEYYRKAEAMQPRKQKPAIRLSAVACSRAGTLPKSLAVFL
ncbi:MAG: tetratricopeptide repeat protein [Bacteroides stercoris]